jgi:thioredoxin-related protein
MKKIGFVLAMLVMIASFNTACGQEKKEKGINWMTIAEAQEAMKKEPRKILIDTYTDWCGWCKRMDASTFSHPDIVKYVNKKYYAVKFDAEQMEDVVFNGKTYKHQGGAGRQGYHELAYALMNGKMSYPTIIYLDEDLNNLSPVAGFMKASQIDMVLKFFGENHYKEGVKWEQFEKTYTTKVVDEK